MSKEPEEEIFKAEITEQPKAKPEKEVAKKSKRVTVYAVRGKELIVIDSEEHGIRIPIPKGKKVFKKGDIIYI